MSADVISKGLLDKRGQIVAGSLKILRGKEGSITVFIVQQTIEYGFQAAWQSGEGLYFAFQ